MSEEYNYNDNGYTNNETNYNSGSHRDGGYYGNDYDPKKPKKKKGGVGRVVAITLGMLLLVGVAAAGGYSAHTILDQLRDGSEEVASNETQEAETETGAEAIENTATSAVNQGTTGSVILTDVSDVVENVMPSIVAITNSGYTTQNFGFWQGTVEIPTEGSGSGIIIGQNDTELLIVTNNHVVENSETLTVQFADNTTAEATIKGTKPNADIAIISVPMDSLSSDTRSAIAIATLGDSDALKIGQGVIAIGNAMGYGQSVTEGCVSALNREVTTDEGVTLTVMQVSAAINPGNSGGALLNAAGEVVGINTAKLMDEQVEGIGYAIPISSVKDLINEMMNYETRERVSEEDASYLGIQPVTVDSQSASMYGMPEGVFVYSVVEGSPAESAGIQEMDIITQVDRYSVASVTDLQDALSYFAGGETVTVTLQRQVDGSYQEMTVDVTLAYERDFTETNQ